VLIFGFRFNEAVACHRLLAAGVWSFDIAGYYGFRARACRRSAVRFVAAAPEGSCAGPVGIGLHHHVCRHDAYHHPTWHDPQLLVNRCRQRTSGCRLWDPVVRRADVRWQEDLNPFGNDGGRTMAYCLLDRAHLRPAGSPSDGDGSNSHWLYFSDCRRTLAWTWRRRVALAYCWPIMVLLLVHAAAIPIHIPLAGAWTHPDPADLDLLTFAIFEAAFVCISTAYLFGGLAKDRIAARYRRASLTDPLTGVANRRGFFETGERLLMRARFAREPTALIVFDLDRFKSVNDRYGHHAGDNVLASFCRLATSQLRPNDLFGRIGGEEFACLLPDTGQHDALWLAERVRGTIEASSHTFEQHAFGLTVSVGVAISDEEYSDLNALLDTADQALYRAKALGGNRVEPSPLWVEQPLVQRAVAI
jgi:diguanylate cyclase (GGDEF)-like protein